MSNAYTYEEVTIQSCAVPIVLSVWTRDPAATTLVFYPGTMSGALYYQTFLECLATQGFNVVGLHPLSHGKSPRSKNLFTFSDIVQNGHDAVTWARKRFKGPVIIAGHSQGGIAALAHAANGQIPYSAPAKVAYQPEGAFLLCTLLPQHPRAIELTLFAPLARWHAKMLQGVRALARFIPFLPVCIPMYLSLFKICHGGEGAVRPAHNMRVSYPLAFIASLFSAKVGQVAHCPLQLISARNDALFTPALLQAMWADIDAPYKNWLLLEGGGHMAPLIPQYAAVIAQHMATSCAEWGLPLSPQYENSL